MGENSISRNYTVMIRIEPVRRPRGPVYSFFYAFLLLFLLKRARYTIRSSGNGCCCRYYYHYYYTRRTIYNIRVVAYTYILLESRVRCITYNKIRTLSHSHKIMVFCTRVVVYGVQQRYSSQNAFARKSASPCNLLNASRFRVR